MCEGVPGDVCNSESTVGLNNVRECLSRSVSGLLVEL